MTFDNNKNQSTNETGDLQSDNEESQSIFDDPLFNISDNDFKQFILNNDLGSPIVEPSAFHRSDDLFSYSSNEQIVQNTQTPKTRRRSAISLSYRAQEFKNGFIRLLNSNCIKNQVLVLHPIISKYIQLPPMTRDEKRSISLYFEHFCCFAPKILETVRKILPFHLEIIRMKSLKVPKIHCLETKES